jgi:DNA-binding beta-propeller fold protein YncE
MKSLPPIQRRRRSVAATAFALALTFAVTGPIPAAHAAGGTQLWATHGPIGSDTANAVATSPDGTRVYVTGDIAGTEADSDFDFDTVAFDAATGAVVWASSYNGPGNGNDEAFAIALSPDGTRVYVTGRSYTSATIDFDFATVGYDATTGAQVWARRYGGPGLGDDRALSVGVSPDGTRVYVTGRSYRSPVYGDFATLAYDAATGAKIWVRRYNDVGDTGGAGAFALSLSPDGARVYVTGWPSSNNYATVAYGAATGATLWVRKYNGPASGEDIPRAIAVSPDGARVFVTGSSESAVGSGSATVAYDAVTGIRLWVRRYTYGPSAIAVSPDSTRVYVTGGIGGSVHNYLDYATVAYDAVTGVVLWVRLYNGPERNSSDDAVAVAVSPDNARVYVTGVTDGRWGIDLASDTTTIAYVATTGAKAWLARYNSPENVADVAHALALSPDGTRVVVAGFTFGPGVSGFTTIAYSTH